MPYSPGNNLIKNDVILLPSGPEEYGSEAELVAEIQAYIHRYVDLSPQFERIASYYVLFSWLYDGFNELPYLRVRGDYGSGKTRFLLVVGSLCYKPVFASGASTVSPIFHILDAFRGTLIIDEGDFRWSDDKADIVKILNNGNVKGLPVLRTEVSRTGEFNPRAFQVFGPKIVATRGFYEDRALESRFITEETGHRALRRDIPINLPAAYKEEALNLRNKLLLYRFRNFATKVPVDALVDPTLEPRLNQIFVPLLSVISDPTIRAELREVARERHREIVADRGMDVEAQVLEVIRNLRNSSPNWRSERSRRHSSSATAKSTSARSRTSGSGTSSGASCASKLKRAMAFSSSLSLRREDCGGYMKNTASSTHRQKEARWTPGRSGTLALKRVSTRPAIQRMRLMRERARTGE